MADDPSEAELAEARMMVMTAIAASPPLGDNVKLWQAQVRTAMTEVYLALNHKSDLMQHALLLSTARVFWEEFLGYTIEQTSTRAIVTLSHKVDADHPDGKETIRTERTDQQAGKIMLAKLKQLKPGTKVIAHKVMEPMRNNPGRTVRVLVALEVPRGQQNVEREADPPARGASSGASARPDPAAAVAARSATAGSHSAPDEIETEWLRKANELLDSRAPDAKYKTHLVRMALRDGLWPPTELTWGKFESLVTTEEPF